MNIGPTNLWTNLSYGHKFCEKNCLRFFKSVQNDLFLQRNCGLNCEVLKNILDLRAYLSSWFSDRGWKQKMREKNANSLLKSDQNDLALQKNCDLKWRKKKAVDYEEKLFCVQTLERKWAEFAENISWKSSRFAPEVPDWREDQRNLRRRSSGIHKEKSLNWRDAINRDVNMSQTVFI